jgi:cyclic pyranopterin phosphate synthase
MKENAKNSAPQDNFNRKIDYLRVSVTDRCNLRCRYCIPEEGIPNVPHSSIMRFEEIELLIRAAISIGFTKVRLTGGEPLVRKGICELVRIIRQIEGLNDLPLTTNGVLLSETAKELKDAGLDRVNISLDTLRPEKFYEITRRDLFHKVIEGIDAAINAQLEPVKINVVLIRGFNDDEVEDFVEITRKKPLSVRFIEFMPISHMSEWTRKKVISSSDLKSRIQKKYELIQIPEKKVAGPSEDYRVKGFSGSVGFITPVTESFCEKCNRIRVTSNGRIRSCLFSDEEHNVLPLLRDKRDIEEIADFIKNSISKKPRCHDIDSIQFRSCQLSMSKIGG